MADSEKRLSMADDKQDFEQDLPHSDLAWGNPFVKRNTRPTPRMLHYAVLSVVLLIGLLFATHGHVRMAEYLHARQGPAHTCRYIVCAYKFCMTAHNSKPGVTRTQLANRCANSEGDVVLIPGNYGHRNLLANAFCSVRNTGIHSAIIAAYDAELVEFCEANDLPCYAAYTNGTQASTEASNFMTGPYRDMVWRKVDETLGLLRDGFNVLLVDTDVFVFRDPLPYLRASADVAQADVVFSTEWESDAASTVLHLNSGFIYLRATQAVIDDVAMVADWTSNPAHKSGDMDQEAYNAILCANRINNDLCISTSGVRSSRLSNVLFPNGNTANWDEFRSPSMLEVKPVMVHGNWERSAEHKLERFRNSGLIAYDENYTCRV